MKINKKIKKKRKKIWVVRDLPTGLAGQGGLSPLCSYLNAGSNGRARASLGPCGLDLNEADLPILHP